MNKLKYLSILLCLTVIMTGCNNDSKFTYKGIVYLDPTDLDKVCTKEETENNVNENGMPTGTKTGCMKWYIFDNSGGKYTMILDHNTTTAVLWNSTGDNENMKEVATQLSLDTKEWKNELNPRLITANEVASVTKIKKFDGSGDMVSTYFNGKGPNEQTQVLNGQGDNEYAWLFDYTSGCANYGCNVADSSTYGYWTSTPVYDYISSVWYVLDTGRLYYRGAASDGGVGIRPVISIQKSKVNVNY